MIDTNICKKCDIIKQIFVLAVNQNHSNFCCPALSHICLTHEEFHELINSLDNKDLMNIQAIDIEKMNCLKNYNVNKSCDYYSEQFISNLYKKE